jgi:hypothetical protein
MDELDGTDFETMFVDPYESAFMGSRVNPPLDLLFLFYFFISFLANTPPNTLVFLVNFTQFFSFPNVPIYYLLLFVALLSISR